MKILVTGANGQLGYDCCRVLNARGIDFLGVDIAELDITDEAAVRKFVAEYRPDAIMHNAAYTAVDLAEENRELCAKINTCGTKYLAEAAKNVGAKFLYISTDYVFNGEKEGEYFPEDARDPQSVYGETKARGEDVVRSATDRHFIVRISWVFGIHGKNFVKTMLALSEKRREVRVVCDQIGSPTYTRDLAELLADIVTSEKYGTYHATNAGVCSWYEFACEIFRLAGKEMTVIPVTTEEYLALSPQQAKRPKNSRMSKEKLLAAGFTPPRDWRLALQAYLEELND